MSFLFFDKKYRINWLVCFAISSVFAVLASINMNV